MAPSRLKQVPARIPLDIDRAIKLIAKRTERNYSDVCRLLLKHAIATVSTHPQLGE